MNNNIIDKDICRVCALDSDNNEPLFMIDKENELTKAGIMFVECLIPEITPNSGYPEKICCHCKLQLTMSYELKLSAINMEKKFRNKLETNHEYIEYLDIQSIKDEQIVTISDNNDSDDNEEYEPVYVIESMKSESDVPYEPFEEYNPNDIDPVGEEYVYPLESLNDDTYETEILVDDGIFVDNLENDNLINISTVEKTATVKSTNMPATEKKCIIKRSVFPKRKRKTANLTSPLSYQFNECDENFVTLNNRQTFFFKRHNNYFSCKLCDGVFATIEKQQTHFLTKHIQFHHQSSEHEAHIKSHDGPPFICCICRKLLQNRAVLNVHEYRHKNVRPVPCEKCDKRFKNKADLKVHMRIHNNIRKYVCDICNKSFRAHTHMTNHRETHVTVNSYECDLCSNKYKTKQTLRTHIQSMHTEKCLFICPVCGKDFGLKFRYLRHMKTHANRKENDN